MDPILVLVGLVMAIVAIGAWQRTTRLDAEGKELKQRLIDLGDRMRSLEEAEVRRRTPSQQPAQAPAAAAATIPVIVRPVEPPPVAPPTPAPIPEPIVIEPIGGPAPQPAFATAVAAQEPAAPNPVMAWLLRGNPLAKLGVVLMFFGLAYLLRFASERGYLPIELRLAGAAAIAMALLFVGWRLRTRMPVYGLTLQGGAIGALYLTSFAAFRVYSLLPHGLVFGLLVIICAASVMLAVLQRAQSLALLASLGGYLAPILLSTGGGNYIALFSYYTLLSAGILAVSFWQAWRPLNLIGFAFTFGVGTLWGLDHYEPSMYGPMQILLAVNLLIYGIFASFAMLRQRGANLDAIVDGTLVFGTPLVGFGLQVGLTRHWEYGPAFSALAFGGAYLPLAAFTLRRWPDRARQLTLSFIALGGGFVTLAIPLALSARWTSMAWALEGLGLLWVGRLQSRARMIWSGTGLLGLAAGSAWMAWTSGLDNPTFFMVGTTLSVTWLVAAWLWQKSGPGVISPGNYARPLVSSSFLFGGVAVWIIVIAGGSERLIDGERNAAMLALLAMSVTSVVWSIVATRASWRPIGECAFLLWPMAWFAFVIRLISDGHPFAATWWNLAWIAAIGASAYMLRWGRAHATRWLRPAEHATFVWLLYALAVSETAFRLQRLGWGADEWQAGGILTVAASVILVLRQFSIRKHWALTEFPRAYWLAGALPAVWTAVVLLIQANQLDGRSPGWPYVPLINPIELAAAFALLMAVVWRRALVRTVGPSASWLRVPILAALVWWINGLLLRTLSMIGDISWTIDALWNSAFIQTAMALAWTVAALVCMAVAAKRAHREAWFVGAGALAAVVAKLFLVDSARGGGLGRAIAFIGVAVLVLLIGYLAPLPPRARPVPTKEGEAVS